MPNSFDLLREQFDMSRLGVKVSTVVLALFLGLGWTWTGFLKDQQIINDTQQRYILIVLSIAFFLQQVYLVIPKPVQKKVIEQRRLMIEGQLAELLAKYFVIVDERGLKNGGSPIVRVNIMLPTKRFRGVLGTYLKIYYFYYTNDAVYTNEEVDNKWRKGEGTCGAAWKINQPAVFDSVRPELKMPAKSVDKKKLDSVKSTKCALSVPIWLDNSVVGVLSLDSKSNIDDTYFLDNEVRVLLLAYARILSGQFFEDGVEG
jgi:hypothetical protein